MKENRFSKPAKTVTVMIVLVLVLGIIIYQLMRNKILKEDGQIISGIVYDYSHGTLKSPGVKFKYFFTVNNKKHYSTSTPYNLNKELAANDFVNKTFPVLVDTADITNSELLLSPSMFNKFGIPFPDSLQWTVNYFE